MGFVILDVTFRVEKAFKIRIPKDWPELMGISWQDGGSDATLAEYHEFVLGLCRDQGVNPPLNSWQTLVDVVEDASGIAQTKLSRETWIIRDIAPSG